MNPIQKWTDVFDPSSSVERRRQRRTRFEAVWREYEKFYGPPGEVVKVAGTGEKRVESLRMADAFRARPVDTTHTSFVFEITGSPSKVDSFVDLMRPLGLVEVSRTGVAAISRGPEAM